MAKNLGESPSKRGPITKIMPSDASGGKTSQRRFNLGMIGAGLEVVWEMSVKNIPLRPLLLVCAAAYKKWPGNRILLGLAIRLAHLSADAYQVEMIGRRDLERISSSPESLRRLLAEASKRPANKALPDPTALSSAWSASSVRSMQPKDSPRPAKAQAARWSRRIACRKSSEAPARSPEIRRTFPLQPQAGA